MLSQRENIMVISLMHWNNHIRNKWAIITLWGIRFSETFSLRNCSGVWKDAVNSSKKPKQFMKHVCPEYSWAIYLSISKRIRLSKEIGHQLIMIANSFPWERCCVEVFETLFKEPGA
jgi:hypothetical protein